MHDLRKMLRGAGNAHPVVNIGFGPMMPESHFMPPYLPRPRKHWIAEAMDTVRECSGEGSAMVSLLPEAAKR